MIFIVGIPKRGLVLKKGKLLALSECHNDISKMNMWWEDLASDIDKLKWFHL